MMLEPQVQMLAEQLLLDLEKDQTNKNLKDMNRG